VGLSKGFKVHHNFIKAGITNTRRRTPITTMNENQRVDDMIFRLLADKDKLLREKDELVDAKNKIWSEVQVIIREKEAGIAQLRSQKDDLSSQVLAYKKRSEDLHQALRDLLEREKSASSEDGDFEETDEPEPVMYVNGDFEMHDWSNSQ
jgi:seryl-tRNA synthetase